MLIFDPENGPLKAAIEFASDEQAGVLKRLDKTVGLGGNNDPLKKPEESQN